MPQRRWLLQIWDSHQSNLAGTTFPRCLSHNMHLRKITICMYGVTSQNIKVHYYRPPRRPESEVFEKSTQGTLPSGPITYVGLRYDHWFDIGSSKVNSHPVYKIAFCYTHPNATKACLHRPIRPSTIICLATGTLREKQAFLLHSSSHSAGRRL